MTLGKTAAASSLWSFLANLGQQFFNFAFFVYVARLLAPQEFGIFALALIFVDISLVAARIGLAETLVREKFVPYSLENSFFWILQILGLGATFITVALAWPMAFIFNNQSLFWAILWLSPACWLQNLSVIPEARLQKAFDFKFLAKRTLISVSVGGVVGAIAASMGLGLYSLILQKLITLCIQNIILWAGESWRPTLHCKILEAGTITHIRSGIQIMMSNLVVSLNTKIMDFLVGLLLGAEQLGFLRTAWKLIEVTIFSTMYPVASVSLSAFSKLNSTNINLKEAYLKFTILSSIFVVPCFFGISAVSELIVPLLFGDKWHNSTSLLAILGFIAVSAPIGPLAQSALVATGNEKLLSNQSFFQAISSVIFTIAAAPLGIIAVCVGQVIRSAVMAYINICYVRKSIGVPVLDTLRALAPACISGLLMWAVITACINDFLVNINSRTLALLASIGCGAIIYVCTIFILFRERTSAVIGDLLKLWRS